MSRGDEAYDLGVFAGFFIEEFETTARIPVEGARGTSLDRWGLPIDE